MLKAGENASSAWTRYRFLRLDNPIFNTVNWFKLNHSSVNQFSRYFCYKIAKSGSTFSFFSLFKRHMILRYKRKMLVQFSDSWILILISIKYLWLNTLTMWKHWLWKRDRDWDWILPTYYGQEIRLLSHVIYINYDHFSNLSRSSLCFCATVYM